MWESQVIREWKTPGRVEEKRSDLLLVLREWFQIEVPADLAQKIQQTTDLGVLTGWLRTASTVPTLDAFRTAIQSTPAPPT